jgi:hypothetical protein
MARIPIIQRTQGISQRTSAGLVPYNSPVADALAAAGGAVKDFAMREQQSLNSVSAQNAASAATAALTDIRDRAKQVPTDQVQTFFKEETEKAKAEVAKGLNSAAAKQFDAEWQRSYLLTETGVNVDRRSRVRDEHVARFMKSYDANLQTLGRLPANDPQAMQLEAQTLRGIQDLHVNGLMLATDAAKQTAKFQSDMSSTYAYRDLLTDPELAVERLADENYAPYRHLDPDRRVAYAKQAQAEAERVQGKRLTEQVTSEALRSYNAGGIDAARDYLSGIASDESIPIELRARMAASGQAIVSVADADEAEKRAQFYADLSVAVSRGSADYAEIDAARKTDRIEHGQWATLTQTLDRRTADMRQTANMIALGNSFYDGTNVLDPRNKDHVKAADAQFATALTSKIEEGATSLEIGQFMLDYVARTGFVPSEVKSQIRGGLRSRDAERVIAAADLVSRLQTINRQAVGDISDDDLTAAIVLNDLRYAGMTDDEAVKEMRATLDPKNKAIADLTDADIKAGKYNKEYLGWMKDDFDGWFGSDFDFNNDMTATAKARANYGRLFETFYRRTGDVDQARKAAKMRLERIWGVTSVEGTSRLIEYPPERIYATQLPMIDDLAGLIEKDIAEAAAQVGGTGKWRIVSDDVTAREAATGRPTYRVLLENENGEFVPVYAKNGVDLRRWGLDVDQVRAEWEVSNDIVVPIMEPGLAAARERAGLDKKPIIDPVEEVIRRGAHQRASLQALDANAQRQQQFIDDYQQRWLKAEEPPKPAARTRRSPRRAVREGN